MSSTFKDNSAQVLAAMKKAQKAALIEMGITGKKLVQSEILSHAPHLFDTGEMYRTIDWGANGVVGEVPTNAVDIGSPKNYSVYVHEGTSRIAGRPFLKDGLLNNKDMLIETAAQELKKGF